MELSSRRGGRCPRCFAELTANQPCSRCVRPGQAHPSPLVLRVGTLLAGQYRIGQLLGQPGGFGITYLAWDERLETRVAIKEFFPRELAGRGTDRSTVQPHTSGDESIFDYGLRQFLQEARTLARFDHPNIVRVRNFFEANRTGYLVMDYYEGESLSAYLDRQPGNRIEEDLAIRILLPVVDGLRTVHAQGILHRDIDPHNIYLTTQGRVILLDFGAARVAMGDRSRSLSVILKPGFAPYEQYASSGKQGPWTDVYACAATLYRMVTGQVPIDAPSRIMEDTLRPAHEVHPGVSPRLSAVLQRALALRVEDRPKTVEELQRLLAGGVRAGGAADVVRDPPPQPEKRFATRHWLAAAGVLTAVLLGGSLLLTGPSPSELTEQAIAAYETGDHEEAFGFFRRAADRGGLEAQAYLGHMYYFGEGVERDRLRAFGLLQNPGSAGYARAQVLLGIMYADGEVVEQDYAAAARWLGPAAAQGDVLAQVRLGRQYYHGWGVERNYERAAELIQGNADAGDPAAQFLLGLMYWNGHGMPKDAAVAVDWWYRSSEQGYEEALAFVHADWSQPPLIPGAWEVLSRDERGAELDRLQADRAQRITSRQVLRMRRLELSFYPGLSLYEAEVIRDGADVGVVGYVRTANGPVLINGTSPRIHQLNNDVPLRTGNVQQATDYVRFFVGAIQSETSRFQLIDRLEDLYWRAEATEAQRRSVDDGIRPLVVQRGSGGSWRATGTVLYDQAVFIAEFHVAPGGMVDMTDDTPLHADLPVLRERFDAQGVRILTES